jgi:hypothetical protein
MSEFWLWFIRPIAEVLGVIAMIVMMGLLLVAYIAVDKWLAKRRKRKS